VPVGDDNANAESRASELQHFMELERRIYDLTRLNPPWVHNGYVNDENYYDDAPEYVLQIRDLTKEREVVIQNLQKYEITRRDAETIGAQLRDQWDVSRTLELARLAGITIPSTPAASEELQQMSRTASSQKTFNPVRRRKKIKLTAREETILEILKKGETHGIVYCTALELKKIPPRREWIEENCPATYPEAYKSRKWRQRIQDEKYRLSQFLPKKRSRHSGPTSGTRPKRVNL
jgi:hypothetical protein